MKSKNPQSFWLRWFAGTTIHAVLFTIFWMSNAWLFTQWYSVLGLNLVGGIVLVALQFWAMPAMMRPSAKRWFSASILGQVIAVILHSYIFIINLENPNPLILLTSLFLPLAICQSWALAERFKKAWLFGIAILLPALMYLGQRSVDNNYQFFAYEMLFWFIYASLSGITLAFLQKYQLRETASINASYKRLELEAENYPDESSSYAKQKSQSQSLSPHA